MEGLAGLAGGFDGLRGRLVPHPPLEVLPVGRPIVQQGVQPGAQLWNSFVVHTLRHQKLIKHEANLYSTSF